MMGDGNLNSPFRLSKLLQEIQNSIARIKQDAILILQ